MLPFLVPALVAGGASLIGAAASAGSQARANNMNLQIMREQNQWNLEQWQRENAYNLPSAQMARLKAAGLNPNMVYANGGAQTAAASSPRAAGTTYQAIDFGLDGAVNQALNQYMQFRQYELQKDHLQYQNELLKYQAQTQQQEAFNRSLVGISLGLKNNLARQTLPYQVQAAQNQAAGMALKNVLYDDQHALNLQQYDLRERAQAAREEALMIQWKKWELESMRTSISKQQYELAKWNLENQERRARKNFNMNYQDWNALRVGKIGNQYIKWADPLVKIGTAYLRRNKK